MYLLQEQEDKQGRATHHITGWFKNIKHFQKLNMTSSITFYGNCLLKDSLRHKNLLATESSLNNSFHLLFSNASNPM